VSRRKRGREAKPHVFTLKKKTHRRALVNFLVYKNNENICLKIKKLNFIIIIE
jgi:hypothetical protein